MNCRPGDLAYVSRDFGSGATGVVVEVLYRSDTSYGAPAWVVQFSEGIEVTCRFSGRVIPHNQVRVPDACLRPISGVPVHDEEHDEVTA